MPSVNTVERKIFRVEGVKVKFKHQGRDVRSDRELPVQYAYKRMLKNASSVNDLKERIRRQYPGFEIDVFKKDGSRAAGQTKLSTVRDTYLDDTIENNSN